MRCIRIRVLSHFPFTFIAIIYPRGSYFKKDYFFSPTEDRKIHFFVESGGKIQKEENPQSQRWSVIFKPLHFISTWVLGRTVVHKSSLLDKDPFVKAFRKCIIYPLELPGYHVYSREGKFSLFLNLA